MDSKGPIEVALSTDLRGEPYNFSLWDIHTGAQLVVFKGVKGNPIARCLQLIDNNYFITAIDNVLQIWSIYNRKSQDQKLFLPARPSSLITSPCGNYLIVGISEMIYIWQLSSGNLVAHNQRHYQTVTVLRMNREGTFLFSGGEDGMVLVWPFADLISNTHNTGALNISDTRTDTGINEPRFCWQHHSGMITDIHVTNGGRCISTSIDKTINIYSYADGRRLHCVADWPTPLWSVIMNKNETKVFLGGQDGNIYELCVASLSLSLMNSTSEKNDSVRKPVLVGHKDKVIKLLVTMDGSILVSASLDSTCKVWDVFQGKMLRDIKHQAPLANLTSLIVPDAFALTSMAQSQIKPPLPVKALKRSLYKMPRDTTLMKEDLFEEASTTLIGIKNKIDLYSSSRRETPGLPKLMNSKNEYSGEFANLSIGFDKMPPPAVGKSDTVNSLKNKIRELYIYSAEKIFQDAARESLQPFKQLIDDINASTPVEPRKDKKRNREPTPKRKTVADEEQSCPPTPGAKTKPLTNGVKRAKKNSNIFR